MPPSFSESKNKPSKNQREVFSKPVFCFDYEDGGGMFLRSVEWLPKKRYNPEDRTFAQILIQITGFFELITVGCISIAIEK
jgi:hypothetical protein